MLTLPTNKQNFLVRIATIPLLIAMEFVFIGSGSKSPQPLRLYTMYGLTALMAYLLVTLICTFFGINKVEIDTTTGVITFRGMLKKKTILAEEIKGYFGTVHKSRGRSWSGLLLQLDGGKTIQLSGQNVLRLEDMKQFMDEKNIVCLGTRKMKFPFN